MHRVIVIVSGGFDPIHSGHISMFSEAKELGDHLIVGINSDSWLERKKGKSFLPYDERHAIVSNMKMVDEVIIFNDNDNTACDLLRKARIKYPDDIIIFANGGDRTEKNIPEMNIEGINFEFGVGGNYKKNSSSVILQDWQQPKTTRPWGYYRVLYDIEGTKVKELTINPKSSLSIQRHKHRAEYWHIAEGCAVVNTTLDSDYKMPAQTLYKHSNMKIPVSGWHQLTNPFDEPCKIIEIQYGTNCIEEDIERK